jgi:hypothetical protein
MLAAAEAVRLDALFVKARFRLAQALRALGELHLAQRVTSSALTDFPDSEDLRTLSVELERVAATVGATRARASERISAGAAAASATSASPAPPAASMRQLHSALATPTHLTACQCYSGHLNMQTDIKEASFAFDDRFVLSGSDDGCLYVYDAASGRIVHVQTGADEYIVNCVQPHPHWPALACSGIADTVRFWEPRHWTGPGDSTQTATDVSARVARNQSRMSG